MLATYRNTKKQGDAGMDIAIAYFCGQGIPVSIPLTDSQDYDLVAQLEGKLERIQVLTTTYKAPTGYYVVGLRVCGGNSKRNFVHKRGTDMDYDYLFAVTETGERYLIPKSDTGNASITLNPSKAKYLLKDVGG